MEIKKSKKAAIERFRTTWLLMGFTVTLAFLFMAFEWSKHDMVVDTSLAIKDVEFVEEIELLRMYDQPAPPPEPEPVSQAEEVLAIYEDTADVEERGVSSSESDNTGVTVRYLPPAPPDEPEVIEEEIYVSVERMPEFPGGQAALFQFLNKNMRYPQVCQESDIQGRVIIQFVVDKDGSVTNPEVVRGVHPLLDKEALRVIQMMPKWTPGMQRLTPVRVRYTVPVTFRLQ